jgi:hypothetical protein
MFAARALRGQHNDVPDAIEILRQLSCARPVASETKIFSELAPLPWSHTTDVCIWSVVDSKRAQVGRLPPDAARLPTAMTADKVRQRRGKPQWYADAIG